MKLLGCSPIRSLFAIVLGLILVLWPQLAIIYIVMAIGVFFILPGLLSLAMYVKSRFRQSEIPVRFPLEGVGSLLLGLWLFLYPGFFVSIFMWMLGLVLMLAGTQQIVTLVQARQWKPVLWIYYLFPGLILLSGVMIVAYPFSAAENTVVIFGLATLFYGCIEGLNWYKFRHS